MRESVGEVNIINARDDTPERRFVENLGLNLDDGMAFFYNDQIYHGDECVHVLAKLSANTGIFNRFNVWVFQSKRRAAFLYPALRCFRNVAIAVRGKGKIGP